MAWGIEQLEMPVASPDIDISVAYFVTDHGYGHASRAVAVMAAIAQQQPGVFFEVFTTAPKWLFEQQKLFRFRYHQQKTDVGLIQSTPFEVDLEATVAELSRFLPFEPGGVAETALYLRSIQTRLVICDIAPIGIAIANRADIPAALIENFTWDWIYRGYHQRHGGLRRFSECLGAVYAAARIRIQVEPFCEPSPVGFKTGPVCRPISADPIDVRANLGLSAADAMVLVSFGGLGKPRRLVDSLPERDDIVFVLPGSKEEQRPRKNVILLPSHPGPAHPDLVNAADAVIGKVGYSTVAEVYQAGVPFGYLSRNDFPESAVLVDFIESHIPSAVLDRDTFTRGAWGNDLTRILSMPRVKRDSGAGAQQVAQHLMTHL